MSHLNSSADYSHKLDHERLAVREASQIPPETNGKTLGQVISRRRSLDFEYNTRFFGLRALGVHGVELPKFAEHCKEYWAANKAGKAATCESEATEIVNRPHRRLHRGSLEVVDKPNQITQSPVALDVYQPRTSGFTDSILSRRHQELVLQRDTPTGKKTKRPQGKAIVFVRRLPKFNLAERLSRGRPTSTETVRTAGFKRSK